MRNPLVCRKCGTIKDDFGANSICPHDWAWLDWKKEKQICRRCGLVKRAYG
jgi:ribosomal protein L37E